MIRSFCLYSEWDCHRNIQNPYRIFSQYHASSLDSAHTVESSPFVLRFFFFLTDLVAERNRQMPQRARDNWVTRPSLISVHFTVSWNKKGIEFGKYEHVFITPLFTTHFNVCSLAPRTILTFAHNFPRTLESNGHGRVTPHNWNLNELNFWGDKWI